MATKKSSTKSKRDHSRHSENTSLNFALPKEMKAQLLLLAEAERRSASSWLVLFLTPKLEALCEQAGITRSQIVAIRDSLKG